MCDTMFPTRVSSMSMTDKLSNVGCVAFIVSLLMFLIYMGYGSLFMVELAPFILLAPFSLIFFVFWISYDMTNTFIRWYRKKFSNQSFDYDYDGYIHCV